MLCVSKNLIDQLVMVSYSQSLINQFIIAFIAWLQLFSVRYIMAVVQIILGAVGLYIALMLSGFHKVREGYVGIYKNFGVLQKTLSEPGIHFRIPFFQEFIEMSISIQTDVVTNIPCGTSNGTMVYFNKVEVVNKLKKEYVYDTVLNYTEDYEKFWITDKLHHEINQFCSKHSLQEIYIDIFDKLDEELIKSLNKDLRIWAPGIEILSIRVTKPDIPREIQVNFEEMEKKKVDYYIEVQREKVVIEQEITVQRKAVIQAQSKYDVKLIDYQKAIQLKQNEKKMATIEATMIFEKAKTQIDTEFLAALEQAQLLPQLYTDKYLLFLASDAYSSNATFTVGEKVPNINLGGFGK